MKTITCEQARQHFESLIDVVTDTREPLRITGRHENVLLISENEWRSVNESLALHCVPGFIESVKIARAAGIDDASTRLDW